MPAIILPDRWRRQPTGPVELNLSNPLASKALFVWTPANGVWNIVYTRTGPRRATSTGTAPTINPVAVGSGRIGAGLHAIMHPFGGANGLAGLNTGISSGNDLTVYYAGITRASGDEYGSVINRGITNDSLRLNAYGLGSYVDSSPAQFNCNTSAKSAAGQFEQRALTKTGASLRHHNWRTNEVATSSGGNGTLRSDGAGDYFYINHASMGTNGHADHFISAAFLPLSTEEVNELFNNPWQLFKRRNILYFPSAGGGGATITGSGTPTAQASTVSGTAERSVTGSGTPTAQASTVAGVAERVITSSGALASQSSAVAGSGSVGNAISGSGTLLAQSSQVAGTAERSVTGSGTPASQSATVSGAAERIVTGTGTPTSQASTVSGTGQVGNVVTGSGTPTAQAATVAGTAERTVTASGALSAQSSTVAGTAERTITGSGALSAQSSTVYGFDSAPVVPDTGGGGSRTVAFSSRKLRQELEEWEQKNQEKERLKRLMREDEELVLIMLALAA